MVGSAEQPPPGQETSSWSCPWRWLEGRDVLPHGRVVMGVLCPELG